MTRRSLLASLATLPFVRALAAHVAPTPPVPTIPIDLRCPWRFPKTYGLRDANLGHRGTVTIQRVRSHVDEVLCLLDVPPFDISDVCIRCNDEEGWADIYIYRTHRYGIRAYRELVSGPDRKPIVERLRGRVVFTPDLAAENARISS